MIRIAIQSKGRLNEQSMELLRESGIGLGDSKRKFLAQAESFPLEILYLRDDDIPKAVAMGTADLGIVGYNEVLERKADVAIEKKLGFGSCRISLAVPKDTTYQGLEFFNGKRIATSYPDILENYFAQKGINADIREIAGSVEIAPAAGMADAIFDIVSSGGTLAQNGLREVEKVIESEAVLISCRQMDASKRDLTEQLKFRITAVMQSKGMKYMLMNLPEEKISEATAILPGMRSPTILPLAQKGWCSMHSVVSERDLWDNIAKLKTIGAEGILILSLEKTIL